MIGDKIIIETVAGGKNLSVTTGSSPTTILRDWNIRIKLGVEVDQRTSEKSGRQVVRQNDDFELTITGKQVRK